MTDAEKRAKLVERLQADASAADAALLLLSADAFEAAVVDMAALNAEKLQLATELAEAEAKLEAGDGKAISLSASSTAHRDPVLLSMFAKNLRKSRELALAAGFPEEHMKGFDALILDANGGPNAICLSSVGANDLFGNRIYELLGTLPKVNGAPLGMVSPPEYIVQASASGGTDLPFQRMAEKYNQGVPERAKA